VGSVQLPADPWSSARPAALGSEPDLGASDAWVDTIRLASERVARLSAAAAAPRGAAAPRATSLPPVIAWDLGATLDLLRQERFAEALALLDAFPSGAADDADVLLLRSVLLAHVGLLDLAETACRRLLAVDDLSAGAHYVLALCREGVGDLAGAVDHDRKAAYLDPRFAMPRLHLGLLARRAGDAAAVRRELAHAATLLETEDASRLLLFGGGFGRAALIALCRADVTVAGVIA
jgi:chemotaxis protein methyltransferase CheR